MFRLLVKYVDREPQVFMTRQFSSISEIKNLFLGSHNPSFNGVDGPVTIDREGVRSVLVQRLSQDGGRVLEKSELKLVRENEMDETIVEESIPVVEETVSDFPKVSPEVTDSQIPEFPKFSILPESSTSNSVVQTDNANENKEEFQTVTLEAQELVASTPNSTVYFQEPTEEVPTMGDENKLTQSFQSFREKYLDRETQETSWEDQIIAKKDQRIAKLKEIADALDSSNENLEAFKKEALGL